MRNEEEVVKIVVLGLSSLRDLGDLVLKSFVFQNPGFLCSRIKDRILVIRGLLSLCVSANGKHTRYKQMCSNLSA